MSILNFFKKTKTAEEKLRKMNRAVEQNPASVVLTNRDGNIEYVNTKFENITGYKSDEVIGKNPRFLKSGNTSPEVYKALWETITNGKEWKGEFLNKKKNGELYWERVSIAPILNNEGEITHFLAIKEDITEFKFIQEKINLMANALESVNDFVCITDKEDKVIYVNKAFTEKYGYSREELIGKNISFVRAEHYGGQGKNILSETLSDSWNGNLFQKKKDGAEF